MTVERVRTAVFWMLALWLLLSPGWVQVGPGRPGIARPWRMYAGVGKGGCDAKFYVRTPEGDTDLPRLATLRPGVPLHDISGGERRVELKEVPKIGQQLCTETGASDVRADVKCANGRGWKKEMRRERNLCRRRG